MTSLHRRWLAPAVLAACALAACAPRASEDDAVVRGDIAFATGNVEAALAEYQLAVRQGDDAWLNIVKWSFHAMAGAEELGVLSHPALLG